MLNKTISLSLICMLKPTHMGVTIWFPQEAETFSILSIWAGERWATGHAPRGIHLSLRSGLLAVATGDKGKCQGLFSLFFNSEQQRSTVCNGRRVILFFSCYKTFHCMQKKWRPSSRWEMFCRKKPPRAPLCWNGIDHWHYGATTFPVWFG